MKIMSNAKEAVQDTIGIGITKANKKWYKTILFGILAGIFVAIGAQASNFAVHGIKDIGIAKTVAGLVFPIGLIMIVFIGGELFTGNCLLIMAALDKKIRARRMVKNLCLVFLGNLIGAVFIAALISGSGQLDSSHGLLGAYTIKAAVAKIGISPMKAFISGILCNIIVCAAIYMGTIAKDVMGKTFLLFYAIFVFVISSFEHCVANMYYFGAGMMAAKNPEYVALAIEHYGVSSEKIEALNIANSLNNIIPVTLGNAVGGILIIGAFIYYLNHEKSNIIVK